MSQEQADGQSTSFGAVAAEYDRARPSYPEAAVDWIVPAAATAAADVGAGTGKLTRPLLARGLEVTAIEPSAGMRETLAAALPEAIVRDGRAEELPLADGAADFALGGRFGPTERFELAWTRPMTADGLVDLLASRSYLIVAPPEQREEFFEAVRELTATHPELARRERFEMPYRTRAFRARVATGGEA